MEFVSILKFLNDIKKNNNREWFEKNKPRYLQVKQNFDDFLEKIHVELLNFEPGLSGLNPKKIAFRIYRDVRFSKDKRPYKTNMGAGFSPGGKMIQEPGYYIHIEPGNSFLAAGMYMPDSANLAKVRQEIDYNPNGLLKILKDKKFKSKFDGLDEYDKVKSAPKGYAKEHPHIELLKNKSFTVSHYFSDAEVKNKNFLKEVVKLCKVVKPFNDYFKTALT